MTEIGAGPPIDPPASSEADSLPPLGIRHLLMFTTGIAVALAIFSAVLNYQKVEDQQFGDHRTIVSLVGFLSCVSIGSGGAFLVWTGFRAYLGKPLPFTEPGAKFAAVISAAIVAKTLFGLIALGLISLVESVPFVLIFMTFILPPLACFIVGFAWIKDWAWRIVIAAQLLTTAFCLFPFSSPVGGAAILYSLLADVRSKKSRHWTHYFGMVVWLFSQVNLI